MTTVKWINHEMFARYCGYNQHIIETFPDEVDTLNDILTRHIETVPYDFSFSMQKNILEFLDYIEGPIIEIVPTSQYKGKILIHYDKSEV